MFIGNVSRRDFLKLGSATLLSLLFADLKLDSAQAAAAPTQGRVQATTLYVRDAPAYSGKKLTTLKRDDLVDIAGQVFGGAQGDYNRQWYRLTNQTYVYSGYVQSVKTTLNPVVSEIPDSGVLGEITIPYADSYYGINISPSYGPRLYYATTHWITAKVVDKREGSIWYRAYDAALKAYYYIRPEWTHIFAPEEIAPLSSQVPENEKHIEIYLDRQLLLAYEWNVPVYAARVATGRKNFESPTGWFHTFHKRPTYHMFGGADEFSIFDLPGVPWDSYITDTGVALHGTYWHNDFGTQHSHGCINMALQDAKWIYRWTLPAVLPNENLVLQPGTGTRVQISQN
jgi:L,D-transpeptidase catalytic domain